MDTIPKPHLYVLLDRSGSMEPMREAVVSGFNQLLAEQQAVGDALLTLVQFDDADPHEVLADAIPLAEMVPLTSAMFVPRGGTPLLDATGRLVTMASSRADALAADGFEPEDLTIVTITDGQENRSVEFTRKQIASLVGQKKESGWTFVFIGAGLDAYAEAGGIGYDHRSVQSWAPDAAGAADAMRSLSESMATRRLKRARGEAVDDQDFFEGHKPAEQSRPDASR